jgi:hypothetical protein
MRLCYQIRDILRTRAPFVIARDGRMSADLTAGRVTIWIKHDHSFESTVMHADGYYRLVHILLKEVGHTCIELTILCFLLLCPTRVFLGIGIALPTT